MDFAVERVGSRLMIQFRDVIVVGTSVGGLEALVKLVSGLADDFPAAILIVLHTSVRSPRMLPAIVGRHTQLSVDYAEQGGNILPGHILFTPPGLHMAVIDEGFVGLHGGERVRHMRPAADVLFRSAAKVYGPAPHRRGADRRAWLRDGGAARHQGSRRPQRRPSVGGGRRLRHAAECVSRRPS